MEKTGRKPNAGRLAALIGSKKRLILLAAGVFAGVLLLLLGSGLFAGGETVERAEEVDDLTVQNACRTLLEEEIAALCDAVDGVSGTEVMVTFSRGALQRYTTGRDGGPATVGSGSGAHALPETTEPPAVSGVGIVCRGGNRAEVQRVLTELVSTTLGISSNRVYVTGK